MWAIAASAADFAAVMASICRGSGTWQEKKEKKKRKK
jgi:hypothetical protein